MSAAGKVSDEDSMQGALRLGKPIPAFHPSLANRVAGVIFGIATIVGAAMLLAYVLVTVIRARGVLPFLDRKESGWLLIGMLSVLSILLGTLGVAFVIICWYQAWESVYVCPDGFYCTLDNQVDVFHWSEVVAVDEEVQQEYFPLNAPLNRLVPSGKARSVVVRRRDGREFAFNATTIRNFSRLRRLLREQLEARNIPWNVVQQ